MGGGDQIDILAAIVDQPLKNFTKTACCDLFAQTAVADGLDQANKMRSACITEGYTAYILNKAAAEGLDAQVHVEAGEEGYPETVTIHAKASPLQRQELTGVLVRELGIDKEAVEWIDPYQSSESMPSCEHTNIPS